ncbi:hypothetical protein [Actinoallomurus iriomotensis]|uniref:2-hydroxyhepta-2,4-diene-1,7-dioate isomerase n=1 Tax=Actinoallomurus iriomotensis TaxID=478107 RepID=A0A9W6S4H4_9ACTN|nr:hypothetical protein [Actinoallomurus iriomotensis]GLY85472.1 hypothetical protein Airi02_034010 [Actinoallomurus iriomotensis]
MKLATVRTDEGTRILPGGCVLLGDPDVGALLAREDGTASADGEVRPLDEGSPAPVVPRPGKVLCVGLNYRDHILEMGRDLPEYP